MPGLAAHELGIAELPPLLLKPENPLKEPGLVRGRLKGTCECEFELLAATKDEGNPKLMTEDNEGGNRGNGLIALGAMIVELLH